MHLDPLFLSRLQWAWVIAGHIPLPAITVGLASFIAVLEGPHLLTGDPVWFRISRFWTRIFAVSFGMASCRGSSCRSSSAPTGPASRMRPRT